MHYTDWKSDPVIAELLGDWSTDHSSMPGYGIGAYASRSEACPSTPKKRTFLSRVGKFILDACEAYAWAVYPHFMDASQVYERIDASAAVGLQGADRLGSENPSAPRRHGSTLSQIKNLIRTPGQDGSISNNGLLNAADDLTADVARVHRGKAVLRLRIGRV